MIRLITAKLIIFQRFAYIVNQFAQLYAYFEIYSKVWTCWIQSKIWCWRDQIDFLRDSFNFDNLIAWYNFIEIRIALSIDLNFEFFTTLTISISNEIKLYIEILL